MKRRTIIVLLILLCFAVLPAFAANNTWELGMSWTPVPQQSGTSGNVQDTGNNLDSIVGFHVSYSFFHILYTSWDALVMPPSIVQGWTSYYRPGFLNLFDAGVRIFIGPFVGYGEVGTNYLYVYQGDNPVDANGNLGANLRLGAGLRFRWWGANISGTAVFSSFKDLSQTLGGLASADTRDISLKRIENSLVPSLNLVLYF